MPHRKSGQTDIAALAASVVAVSVALFVVPGPFDLFGIAIALTTLMLIYGYAWPGRRERPQSAGLAGVVALSTMPIIGWALQRIPALEEVHDGFLVAAWAVVAAITYLIDRIAQTGSFKG